MKRLVIDDYRTFLFDAEHKRNIFDAYNAIVNDGPWDEIWWDFDMGIEGGDNTYGLALYLERNPELVQGDPVMYIHSSNPVGAMRVFMALQNDWTTKRVAYSALRRMIDLSMEEDDWE